MKDFVASAASTSARWGRVERNLALVRRAALRAAKRRSRLLLLPECCLTGGDWPTGATSPSVNDVALTLDSEPVSETAQVAVDTGLVIAAGFYERHRGRIYVTQALLSPNGLEGVYRKVHEGRRSSRDRNLFPVFDLPFARVGISICRDNMLPESARILALKGAEVLLAPFMSLPLSRKAWRLQRLVALRARAQDNHVFVLSASHAMPHVEGKPPEWGYSGICCAVNPLGEMMAESKGRAGRPQSVTVDLRAEILKEYFMGDAPTMQARRPAAYGRLVEG